MTPPPDDRGRTPDASLVYSPRMIGNAGSGAPSPAAVRRGNRVARFLRAVARLPKGHGLIWRVLVPLSPPWWKRIVTDIHGFYLHLDLRQLLDFEYVLGTYDKVELEFLVDACGEDGHFLDIGANQGFYSLFVSARRPRTKILAFEPDAYSLRKLRRNIAANGFENIVVCPYALSDTEERRVLHLEQGRNRGASSLIPAMARTEGAESRVEVPCVSLMSALRENGVSRVRALKIDVEGAEYPVLRSFFEQAPRELFPGAVVVEALGDRIAKVGGSPIELLFERGYRIVHHNRFNFMMRLGDSR